MTEEIWKNLPVDLVEKICNTLPLVRRIDPELKDQIIACSDYSKTFQYLAGLVYGYSFRLENTLLQLMFYVMNEERYSPLFCFLTQHAHGCNRQIWLMLTKEERERVTEIVQTPWDFFPIFCVVDRPAQIVCVPIRGFPVWVHYPDV
jgi:hypothetical protein